MIDLGETSQAMLWRLVEAGGAGLPLSDVGPAFAITLSLHGNARITPAVDGPQRVIVTSQGAAFARRQAFA